ncbi:MAG: TrbC/VirB2 family protein [Vicinamibacteraceae bacterium]
MSRTRQAHALLLAGTSLLAFPGLAAAQPGGQPWVDAANQLARLLSGPLASALVIIAIAIAGYLFMFGEPGSKRTLAGVVFGGALALGAVQFATWLFPGITGP